MGTIAHAHTLATGIERHLQVVRGVANHQHPISRNAKLLHQFLQHGRQMSCGGTSHGKCEVDPEMDCAWTLIHNQLKKEGREDKRAMLHEPKDWNVIRHPGAVVERGAEKQKMGSEN